MWVNFVNVRGPDGAILLHTLVTYEGGKKAQGVRLRPGFYLITGVTGSGKTVFAEALWLAVNVALAKLSNCGDLADLIVEIVRRSGVRAVKIDYAEICFDADEVYAAGERVCIRASRLSPRGVEGLSVAPPGAEEKLTYALSQLLSVPQKIRESLHLLGRVLGVAAKRVSSCNIPLTSLLPPLQFTSDTGTVVFPPGAQDRIVAEFDRDYDRYFLSLSIGELNKALVEASLKNLDVVHEEALDHNVYVTPTIFLDDGLDGLDGGSLYEHAEALRKWGKSHGLYITTHRVEAGQFADGVYVVTYRLGLSKLIDHGEEFRLGLVNIEDVPDKYEEELNRKIVGIRQREAYAV